jgi:hypothetical protein
VEDTRLHWRRARPDCVLRECTRRELYVADWTTNIRACLNDVDALALQLPIVDEQLHELYAL